MSMNYSDREKKFNITELKSGESDGLEEGTITVEVKKYEFIQFIRHYLVSS